MLDFADDIMTTVQEYYYLKKGKNEILTKISS